MPIKEASFCEVLTALTVGFFFLPNKQILMLSFFLLDQQMALIAQIPTSPHSIQITKLTRQIEPETDILFEKLFDDK